MLGIFQTVIQNSVYVFIVAVLMYIVKRIEDKRTSFDDDYQIIENSNMAIALRRMGLYLGLAIGMSGTLYEESSTSFYSQIISTIIDGILVIVLMYLAWYISKLATASIISCYDKEVCENKNVAVGSVEGAIFISTGLIVNGAFTGTSPDLMTDILSTMLFFALGQIIMVLLTKFYSRIVNFNVIEEIGKGNAAAGLLLVSGMISISLVLRNCISGDFVSWTKDLTSFAVSTLVGIVVLIIYKKIYVPFYMSNSNIETEIVRDKNIAAALVIASVMIGGSFMISSIV